jgi:hypothetical protein
LKDEWPKIVQVRLPVVLTVATHLFYSKAKNPSVLISVEQAQFYHGEKYFWAKLLAVPKTTV